MLKAFTLNVGYAAMPGSSCFIPYYMVFPADERRRAPLYLLDIESGLIVRCSTPRYSFQKFNSAVLCTLGLVVSLVPTNSTALCALVFQSFKHLTLKAFILNAGYTATLGSFGFNPCYLSLSADERRRAPLYL
jgi:hypothetical protein